MNEIKERPICPICNKEPALIMFGNRLVCGRCAVKLNEANEKFKEKFNQLQDRFLWEELNK